MPVDEPYAKRTAQGLILGPDGEKMSKSKGNVVDPNDVVDVYGADVLRVYVLFMGDYEQAAPWNEDSMKGCKRFLDRVWGLQDILTDGDTFRPEMIAVMHRTIKKVSEDIEAMKFNTAIASMMTLLNTIYENGSINRAEYGALLRILNPFAPHMTEEIYQNVFGKILSEQSWPAYDDALCVEKTVEMAVQVNGKLRGRIRVPTDADAETVLGIAKADEVVGAALAGKTLVKEIVVPNKIVNLVVK